MMAAACRLDLRAAVVRLLQRLSACCSGWIIRGVDGHERFGQYDLVASQVVQGGAGRNTNICMYRLQLLTRSGWPLRCSCLPCKHAAADR